MLCSVACSKPPPSTLNNERSFSVVQLHSRDQGQIQQQAQTHQRAVQSTPPRDQQLPQQLLLFAGKSCKHIKRCWHRAVAGSTCSFLRCTRSNSLMKSSRAAALKTRRRAQVLPSCGRIGRPQECGAAGAGGRRGRSARGLRWFRIQNNFGFGRRLGVRLCVRRGCETAAIITTARWASPRIATAFSVQLGARLPVRRSKSTYSHLRALTCSSQKIQHQREHAAHTHPDIRPHSHTSSHHCNIIIIIAAAAPLSPLLPSSRAFSPSCRVAVRAVCRRRLLWIYLVHTQRCRPGMSSGSRMMGAGLKVQGQYLRWWFMGRAHQAGRQIGAAACCSCCRATEIRKQSL